MRSRALSVFITAFLLGVASRADATTPTFVTIQVNRTFVSPFFSAACGFAVTITEIGTLKATVFTDATGAILAETDTQPGYVIMYSSIQTGKAFAYPFSTVLHFDYPNGTTPGAPVLLVATGLADKVPGVPADAGLVTYGNATMLFVDPSGVPIVDFGPPTAFNGNVNNPLTAIAAGCAALAP
jgi:hypothetical protein